MSAPTPSGLLQIKVLQIKVLQIKVPLVLAIVLGCVVMFGPTDPVAVAVSASSDRGGYLVVTARSGEGDAQVLWLLDTRAEELAVAGWSQPTNGLKTWGTRSLQQDLQFARRHR